MTAPGVAGAASGGGSPGALCEALDALDVLDRDIVELASEVDDALAESERASGLRADLASHVLPLSLKGSVAGSPLGRDRYLAGLERRRIRLQREGQALAERLAEITQHAQRMRDERDTLAAHLAALRGAAAQSVNHLRQSEARREEVMQAAGLYAAHRTEVLAWAQRVVRHRRRVAKALETR